ncbi:MAG: HAMP domain-containing histidine kinase [Deltaproteobacteria bacterium]|nr:HAMP domain-containing histidine kinase [Deltaproteobacteria bacterium]
MPPAMSSSAGRTMAREARRGIDLSWLVTLRWGALAGQLATILAVDRLMGIALPLAALVAVLAIGAASNLGLAAWRRRAAADDGMLAAVMLLDVGLLTAVLYFTGGPFNPFSFLYLVNVALAAVILPARSTWALAGVSLALFFALFFAYVPLPIADHGMGHDHGMAGDPPISLHVRGMWVAFGVAAAFIVYFIQRVRRALAARDAELAEALRDAVRHEKLASLATLAAGAAHELATPLSTIAVVAKELERALGADAAGGSAAADARLIREQVQRCRDILEQMAADAGESAGEAPTATTIAALLAAATETLAERARVEIAGADADAAWTDGPPRALVQALRGVVKNALEASTGAVRVEVAPAADARAADGGAWRVVVTDRGAGMTPGVLARAGEPFFTTKNRDGAARGMGLGIFLARAVLERVGGSIEIASTLGRGTTVTVVLPRAGAATVRRIDRDAPDGMVRRAAS